jgi:hypothetical protein
MWGDYSRFANYFANRVSWMGTNVEISNPKSQIPNPKSQIPRGAPLSCGGLPQIRKLFANRVSWMGTNVEIPNFKSQIPNFKGAPLRRRGAKGCGWIAADSQIF